MRKVNVEEIDTEAWSSPKGTFAGEYKGISLALGRKPESTDLRERHPFDVELSRLPAGKKNCPYHSHGAQWELYLVISGRGTVRHEKGITEIGPGDAFIFAPGEPHQLVNDGVEDMLFYVIADNPMGDSCYYPDSKKWCVYSPEQRFVRSEPLSFTDGEE